MAFRRLSTVPVPPPLPADPKVCRWCGSQREIAAGYWLCPRGCAGNDSMPREGWCEDCRREYATGGLELRQCHACSERERGRLTAEYASGQSHTGYTHRMRMDGANRHAVETLRKDVDG